MSQSSESISELHYYVIAAHEVIESMRKRGLLKGPGDQVRPKGHRLLGEFYARGWRPDREMLFDSVILILEEASGRSWSEDERKRMMVLGVDHYLRQIAK